MNKKHKILVLTLCTFCLGESFSQQNTVATGGEASGSGGTVSYSVGQIDFTAQSGTNGSINQGVQQPLEFFVLGIEDQTSDFSVVLYPNPVVAELHIDLKDVSLDQLSFVLTDVNGKIIDSQSVNSNEITINMADLSRANYFLNFTRNGKVEGSYQIIKNN